MYKGQVHLECFGYPPLLEVWLPSMRIKISQAMSQTSICWIQLSLSKIRSGIPITTISELHGNGNVERCSNCKKSYWRKFRVREANGVHEHTTSRQCDYCKDYLHLHNKHLQANCSHYQVRLKEKGKRKNKTDYMQN
ncbi:hypothetical protein RhiirA1_441611 [Rhizophagus irregularis]|uniref:Uncharacterized protein n=1 Tax=Rhizophagus irregularis TaxID=588596 RepID=A0A2I1DVK0_9GLOM|nr:hypothetical protein RhiirA1_441611 [Rhizophagus irregularis]PKY13907.1 hypothetical protein RhiirB3_465716 [Rhizophagus irregularis]